MESIESQKIEVGDIFSTAGLERDVENKILIMVANIICDGEPGSKVVNSSWGTRHYNSDGCSLNYKVSLDNGETWNYEDGEGHYVDIGWIGELVKMGHWSLLQKNINFFDSLTESEENYEWLEDLGSETFQNVLIKNNPRIPHLSDDIDIIMFNPSVAVGDKRFNKIAYWLEDEDYYPEILEEYNIKTSYIEITRHKDDRQNGRWKIGPELNEQELYNLSQTPKHPNWNGNFWEEEVLQVI